MSVANSGNMYTSKSVKQIDLPDERYIGSHINDVVTIPFMDVDVNFSVNRWAEFINEETMVNVSIVDGWAYCTPRTKRDEA